VDEKIIARRILLELIRLFQNKQDTVLVNLGIGIPAHNPKTPTAPTNEAVIPALANKMPNVMVKATTETLDIILTIDTSCMPYAFNSICH
jgi:hypothetical protein